MMSDHAATSTGLLLKDGTYDFLRRIVELVFPGFGALYFGAAAIWGAEVFPNADKVVGTISLLVVFISLVLRVSRKNYVPDAPNQMGAFVINTTDMDRAPYRLELDADLHDLEAKEGDVVSFKVKNSA
jgi:hypothetical protein